MFNGNEFIRKYEKFRPNNMEIFDYYEQDEEFKQDKSDKLRPWIGSIYTFRPYRGNRYSAKLIKYILQIAKDEGDEFVYLSSDNKGMYEKFGFDFYDMMTTVKGNETQVFVYNTKKL